MPFEMLVPLLAIFMFFLVILVPVVGITARIALKPIMEGWARYREMRGEDQTVQLLSQRMALMEEHMHGIERALGQIHEELDFRRQLDSGGAAGALPSRSAGAPPRTGGEPGPG
jgi:hypothetical protein